MIDPTQIEFWHWWVAGIIFVVIEVFAPGAIALWMGISAGLVGFLLLAAPGMTWEYQLMTFAVLSVISVVVWRVYQKRHPTQTDQPALNRRGEQYVGRVLTLDEAIVNGTGKVRVDDSTWKVVGADMALGAQVRVTGVDGTIFTVEPA